MCPVCQQVLLAAELEGVEIDYCASCHGTWLDTGEIEWIAKLAGVSAGGLSEALQTATGRRHGSRRCPRCGRKLRIMQLGKDGSIELDSCPGGHGFWFDEGEMQQFIATFGQGEEGAVARFLARLYGWPQPAGQAGTIQKES